MANIKIAQLTNQTTIADTDLVIVETATSTNKMTVANFKNLLGINQGGVVESGSNANGTFIKFSDGTMICTMQKKATFLSARRLYMWTNYPAGFIAPPVLTTMSGGVDATNISGDKENIGSMTVGTNASTNVDIYVMSNSSNFISGNNIDLYITAIGRWKA